MSKRTLKILSAILLLVGIGILIIGVLNSPAALDRLRAIGYAPSAEVAKVRDEIKLTDTGLTIFNATRPVVEGQNDFNQHCNSHNEKIAVLGCYTNGNMYLYGVTDSELSGVVESTAAHELLHAVWARLNNDEQAHLSTLLNQVYAENRTLFDNELEVYDADSQIDELHSRIGTQIKNLPTELEDHYARYFQDQDAVVAFYVKYSKPFKRLEAELAASQDKMQRLAIDIDAKTADYLARSEALVKKVNEFNNCAAQTGCFKNEADFNTQRAALVAEQEALKTLYAEIDQLVKDYNTEVNIYNNNVLRTQTLNNKINSNNTPPTV